MKIEKQLQDDHQMQLTVEVEPELMQSNKRRAARQLAQRGKIPGFRPGKAPYDIIVRHFGEGAIIEQAMDLLVDDIYPKVLEQAEIKPAAPGSLEKIETVDPPKLVFRVPLAPEVALGDYRSVRQPYEWSAPGEKELEDALTNLRQMYATTESVERPIAVGDFVLVDVKGSRDKPKEEEEDRAAALSRDGFAVVIRQESDKDEWPFPGFSKQLVGLKPGEDKTIKHKYPKDDADESLRGETVNFEVSVKTVRGMTLPELDDEFAKMTGQFETVEALKTSLMENLQANSKQDYEDSYFKKLIEKIKESATIKYPPQVLEHEAEQVVNDLRQRLSQQNLDLDTYFKMRKTTLETFMEEEARPVAIKRLERSLILDKLAHEEKITVDDSSLKNEFGQTLTELQYQGLDLNKVSGGKQGQQQLAEAVAMESAHRLLTRRTLERIKAIATGEFKPEEVEQEKKPKKAAASKGSASVSKGTGKSAKSKSGEEEKTGQVKSPKSASKKPKPAVKKDGSE